MKKLIILFLSLLAFTSCITKKACDQKFPPQIITKDSIVIKDTTIYVDVPVIIPGDSIVLVDTLPCPINYEKEVVEDSKKISVKIKDGVMIAKCSTDSLLKVIQDLEVKIQNKEKYSSTVEVVPVEVVKYKTPMWCWWLLSIFILWILIKFKNPVLLFFKTLLTLIIMASYISAGHNPWGDKPDNGACYNNRKEAIETIRIRDGVVAKLKASRPDIKIFPDRDSERLADYLKRIQPGDASVVVEFHLDAASNLLASGATAVVADNASRDSKDFAKELVDVTAESLGIKNRGVIKEQQTHRGKLGLMRKAGIVSLLEVCFITNENDMKALDDKKKFNILCSKLADVIAKYDDKIS